MKFPLYPSMFFYRSSGRISAPVSAIDYVNKNRKPAYIGSYNMVKAYNRAMISFLLRVMDRMGFQKYSKDG